MDNQFEKLISIIIPVYNVEGYLKKCLDSVLAQTYRNIEVILIEDGSPDNCGMLCDEYANMDNRVKVIHKKNGGLSSARNSGLDICTGDYIGFVDSDDYINSNMYEELVAAIEMQSVDIACAGIIRESDNNTVSYVTRCPKNKKQYNDKDALREILLEREIDISVWSKLYKKEVFANVRFPEGETNEDAAILLDIIPNKKLFHIAKPMYHYIDRAGSITSKYNKRNCELYWRNSRNIFGEISKTIPELKGSAVQYLNIGIKNILFAYMFQNEVVDPMYKEYFDYYKKHWVELIKNSDINKKDKIKCILLRMHLLRLGYKLFAN